MRPLVVDSFFLHLFAVDSLDVLTLRNSFVIKKKILVKVCGRLGDDKQDVRELRVLDRVLSWRSGGIQLEAGPRHQEILISELEQDVRGLSTPAVKSPQRQDGDGDGAESMLDEAEAHCFRSTAARESCLALDRPDMAFATKRVVQKEGCRHRRKQI